MAWQINVQREVLICLFLKFIFNCAPSRPAVMENDCTRSEFGIYYVIIARCIIFTFVVISQSSVIKCNNSLHPVRVH